MVTALLALAFLPGRTVHAQTTVSVAEAARTQFRAECFNVANIRPEVDLLMRAS